MSSFVDSASGGVTGNDKRQVGAHPPLSNVKAVHRHIRLETAAVFRKVSPIKPPPENMPLVTEQRVTADDERARRQ